MPTQWLALPWARVPAHKHVHDSSTAIQRKRARDAAITGRKDLRHVHSITEAEINSSLLIVVHDLSVIKLSRDNMPHRISWKLHLLLDLSY